MIGRAIFIGVAVSTLAACGAGNQASTGTAASQSEKTASGAKRISKQLSVATTINNEAIFSGNRANYTIASTATGYTVIDNVGDNGTTTLIGTTLKLRFADVSVSLGGTEGNAGQVYRLYQASFNRTPDLAGLGWQIAAMDKGVSLLTLSENFMNSAEFQSLYGTNLSNSAFITQLYNNVLHRTPEQAGLDHWLNVLGSNQLSRAQVLYYFSESAENKNQVLAAIQNGITYIDATAVPTTSTTTTTTTTTANNPLIRATQYGQVEGKLETNGSAYAWLGIPFAAPPTGALRWRAPADPPAWDGIFSAKQFGNACMQIGGMYGPQPTGESFGVSLRETFSTPVGSEDCLVLNIWRPASAETNLPVLVFIHGGSNRHGWSGTPDYHGGNFAAEQKAVVVSVQYRTNLFGWFHHPAIKTGNPEEDSGNFANLDLIKSLKFVKNNIGAFGGDPANVTVAGHSSGANNLWSLITSPKAAGLFHKAMPMSGAANMATMANGLTFSTAVLQRLLINDGLATDITSANAYIAAQSNQAIKNYLYSKSAQDLVSTMLNTTVLGLLATNYMDGTVLPPSLTSRFTGSYLNNVPVLSSVANHEGRFLFVTDTWNTNYRQMWTYLASFNQDNPSATPVALSDLVKPQWLPVNRPYTSCSDVGYILYAAYCASINGAGFWSREASTLDLYRPLQPKTYSYNFSWAQQPEPWKSYLGAIHGGNVPFIFGNFGPGLFSAGYSAQNKQGREALALTMRKSVSAFMKTGDPNNAAIGMSWPTWPTTVGAASRLVFNASDTVPSVSISTMTFPSE